jgi:hypothetical protein
MEMVLVRNHVPPISLSLCRNKKRFYCFVFKPQCNQVSQILPFLARNRSQMPPKTFKKQLMTKQYYSARTKLTVL